MAKRRNVGLSGPTGNRNVKEQRAAGVGSITPGENGNLRLSGIEYRDPRTLTDSPHNEPFKALKDSEYMDRLQRDIADAGEITEPLLITPDGEIVSGHSRRDIALRLELDRVPVRIIEAELSEQDKKSRVYLANLSRFEIDKDTRLQLYAEIYPEYFNRGETVSPQDTRGDTVSPKPRRADIAQAMGVSERQVKNERAVYEEARKTAGGKNPDREAIAAARKKKNEARKTKQQTPSGSAQSRPKTTKAQEPPRWEQDEVEVSLENTSKQELISEVFNEIERTRDYGEGEPKAFFDSLRMLVVRMQERLTADSPELHERAAEIIETLRGKQ